MLLPDQPPPTPGDGDVWAEVIAELPPGPLRDLCEERRRVGLERYGVPLQRGNGRDPRADLLAELLDGIAYARQWGRWRGQVVEMGLRRLVGVVLGGGGQGDL